MYEIRFPHLGISLKHVLDGFSIGGFEIRFYGVIIAIGFVLAIYWLQMKQKERIRIRNCIWIICCGS